MKIGIMLRHLDQHGGGVLDVRQEDGAGADRRGGSIMGRLMISRRAFLRTTALLGAGALGWSGVVKGLLRTRPQTAADPVSSGVASLFSDPARARAVGMEYLRTVAVESDPPRLRRLIMTRLGLAERPLPPPERLRAEIARGIREDFAAGQTVQVAGWILSRTEARVCALVALS